MSNSNYNITLLAVLFTFALLSIIVILNSQRVYSDNPDSPNPEVSHLDVNNTSSVSKFSVAAWFKTSNDYKSDAFIVNKAGSNGHLNYGIWMTSAEKIQAGFETSGGKPMYATSPLSYSDGKWHYAVVTYDGSFVNLYVDGKQVATKPASGTPDNGGNDPVRVGANSGSLDDYFVGEVDEVRVWNNALTTQQVFDASNGSINTKDQIVYLDFSEPINATAPVNQTAINATAPVNQTAINATAPVNQTAINATSALNQTAINATSALNQTAINATAPVNQTAINATAPVNQTAINATSALNQTALNETSFKLANETSFKLANETITNATEHKGNNETILSIVNPHAKNETGATNQTTVENQTSESKISKANSLPNAFDQTVSVDQNNHADITLVADDKDKDQLQFAITADPSHGTLVKLDKEKGTITYIPEKDYSGNDKFSFRATDVNGGQSQPANVDIKVNSASQPNENETKDNINTQSAKSAEVSSNETSSTKTAETNAASNIPPKADAGNDVKVNVNTKVELDGAKSSDDDGKIVSYKWEQTDGPHVTLDTANEQKATFNVPDSAGGSKLTFKLTVVDDKDASSSDDVTVQVEKVADNPADKTDTTSQQNDSSQQSAAANQVKENIPPKADAGGDQKAKVNTEVKLDGGKSIDDDGKIITYKWEQTDGPKVDLKNSNEQIANFDVPDSAADKNLSFKLTVVDDKDASDSDDTTVQVEKLAQENQ
jgi:hypothetical protein